MFDPNTYLKILRYLDWRIDRADEIKSALTNAEADPLVEAEIKEILAKLAGVCTALEAELGSANAGLIRADVLEWESPEARTRGMKALKIGLIRDLANLLRLDYDAILICPGGTRSVKLRVI